MFFQNRLNIHQQRTMDTMPSFKVLFFPEGISNHYPTKIVLNEECTTRKAFQICNVWKKHSKFVQVLQEGLKVHIQDRMIFQVVRKLELLKKKLRDFHTEEFQNIMSEENVDMGKMKRTQIQLQKYPYSTDCQQ